ncbi:MAG: ketopantoate reductase family protein [Actinomycetota bacterium]|nr:ketopantoate reductase family protein [Actinomycetota bacterium]
MRIAVLGPGGVGGFLAAALTRAGQDVLVVARESTAARIAERGVSVESAVLGEFKAHPRTTPELSTTADVLFVTTKATGIGQALDRVSVAPLLVVPLLNGIEHMSVLRERFGHHRVVAGVIRIDSDRPEAGRIVQRSPTAQIDLAADDEALSGAVRELARVIEHAGLPVQVGTSETQVLWSKLVRLNALACTTSASGHMIGYIRSDPVWRQALEDCVRETAAVAVAEGADIDVSARLRELDQAHAELGSSMSRDIAAGREPELDAIAGAVLRAAARHGLSCPTVARLSAQIAARAGIHPPP